MFCKKGVLKNYENLTGKRQCWSFFLSKVGDCRPGTCNFIEKETPTQVFSCELGEVLKNTFFSEHLRTTASVKGSEKGLLHVSVGREGSS